MNNWCEFNAPDRKIIIKSFLNYSTNRATGYCGCGRRLPTQKKNGIGGQESREYRAAELYDSSCSMKLFFFWGAMRPETEMKVRNKMLEENQISLLPSGTQAPNFQRRHGFKRVCVYRGRGEVFVCELIVIFPMENHGWIISWNKKIGEEFCDCNCLSLL